MRTIIAGTITGVIGILILSLLISPYLCNSIKQDYKEINCNSDYVIKIFFNIYSNPSSILLLLFGAVSGGLIGRAVALVKLRMNPLERELLEKKREKQFKFPWEYGK
jgi:hypothetical protein